MEQLTANAFHIALYTVAYLICWTIFYCVKTQGRTDRLQTKLFSAINGILAFNALSGIVRAVVKPYLATLFWAPAVLEAFQFLYFFFHTALAPLFYLYALTVVGKFSGKRDSRLLRLFIPFYVTELLVLTNPITHFVYHYDASYVFHRAWGEALVYAAAVYFFSMTMWNLLFSWRSLTPRRRQALLYFISITLTGVVIQLLFIQVKCELFAEALGMMGLLVSVENEDDIVETDSGFYNRKALRVDLDSRLSFCRTFYVICLKITNTDIIRRVTGSANTDILSNTIADFLQTIVPRYQIYHPNPETFVLLVMDEDRNVAAQLARRVSERFEQPWAYRDTEFPLHAITMYAALPDELHDTDDVFFMVDHSVPRAVTGALLSGSDLDFLVHRMDVENAIRRGVRDRLFQVYYQPTYHLDGRLHGAEALVRLDDEKLGFISPEEFVPIAEQLGVIEEIDDYILREVCAFLQSGVPMECGMDSINVNLSVIQCMRPGFSDHIYGIVDSYNIRRDWINFEITESVAAHDYHLLSDVVGHLKDSGFLFSMDDYGTGYSNMTSMFSLNFDIIKIDKSILWGAMESEQGRIILENSVQMIRQMGRRILVEGVETKEQLELLQELGVDFLQGFYFSQPVPKDDFIKFIRRNPGVA